MVLHKLLRMILGFSLTGIYLGVIVATVSLLLSDGSLITLALLLYVPSLVILYLLSYKYGVWEKMLTGIDKYSKYTIPALILGIAMLLKGYYLVAGIVFSIIVLLNATITYKVIDHKLSLARKPVTDYLRRKTA